MSGRNYKETVLRIFNEGLTTITDKSNGRRKRNMRFLKKQAETDLNLHLLY